MSEHTFTLTSAVETVRLETAAGAIEEFVLTEMTAAVRDRYLDGLAQRVSLDPQGRPIGVKKFTGMQADLLVLCLKRKDGSKPPTLQEIQEWPASVVSKLYELAQKVNQLTKDETEKND